MTKSVPLLDNMHSVLVDLLIEKGTITDDEYEKYLKAKVKIK
jgi:hypothetical protein